MTKDFYRTIDPKAVTPLLPQIPSNSTYAEPCVGDGDLVSLLPTLTCLHQSDIELGYENLTEEHISGCDYIITNPPWSRQLLHPMITHFSSLRPTWLLFDADWAHTKQSIPYMSLCRRIVSVGRLKWMPDTTMSGKDNAAWYLFYKGTEPTIFIPRV